MRIFHASPSLNIILRYRKLFPEIKPNVLRSFAIPSSDNEGFMVTHRDEMDSFIFDSGVYSYQDKIPLAEIPILFSGYREYLLSFGDLFNWYFNFDIEFSEIGFESNVYYQTLLEDVGLKPVPVIHDLFGDEVQHYIDKEYAVVAIGSQQVTIFETLFPIVGKLYDAGIKVHLFGTSKFELISELPVHSCDTTSWALTGGYGRLNYWNPHKPGENKTDSITLEDYEKEDYGNKKPFLKYRYRKDLEAYLDETFGLTYEKLFDYEGYYNRMLINLHYFVEMQERVSRIHEAKGFNTG